MHLSWPKLQIGPAFKFVLSRHGHKLAQLTQCHHHLPGRYARYCAHYICKVLFDTITVSLNTDRFPICSHCQTQSMCICPASAQQQVLITLSATQPSSGSTAACAAHPMTLGILSVDADCCLPGTWSMFEHQRYQLDSVFSSAQILAANHITQGLLEQPVTAAVQRPQPVCYPAKLLCCTSAPQL